MPNHQVRKGWEDCSSNHFEKGVNRACPSVGPYTSLPSSTHVSLDKWKEPWWTWIFGPSFACFGSRKTITPKENCAINRKNHDPWFNHKFYSFEWIMLLFCLIICFVENMKNTFWSNTTSVPITPGFQNGLVWASRSQSHGFWVKLGVTTWP